MRSAFIARHMEQPGSRHSNPAALKIMSSPSLSACRRTSPEPGTTRACLTLGARRRPSFCTTAAAARRSSMRALVHEPMKTWSGAMSVIFVPAVRPMYLSARTQPSFLTGSVKVSGSGTTPSIVVTISGDVPQLTIGRMAAASISTVTSKWASASETSVRQYCSAFTQSSPVGAKGRLRM